MANPRIIVLTAPSGAGKSSISRRILEVAPTIRFSVSATTRSPRPYESDGTHYHFLSAAEFDSRIENDEFVEYEEVYPGLRYGTLVEEVARATPEAPVLLDIDVRGALRVKELFGGDALVIFVAPPSLEELAVRLHARGTDSVAAVNVRLERAREELTWRDSFDRVVVNDDLERASAEAITMVSEFLQPGSEERANKK